ncbi:MAG TPA: sulfurtransferase TusE [Gammaproteobacteria bacterium]|nr:sulfurtransferase TusE [Gammaproteobacteria bacterium]
MSLQLNGTTIEVDNEGYLLNTDDWSPELAAVIARVEGMELTDERLEIVHFVREQFEERECIPEMRTLLKALREKHGKEIATRKYVYKLFPYGYGQQACKIAGMRKPLKLLLDL